MKKILFLGLILSCYIRASVKSSAPDTTVNQPEWMLDHKAKQPSSRVYFNSPCDIGKIFQGAKFSEVKGPDEKIIGAAYDSCTFHEGDPKRSFIDRELICKLMVKTSEENQKFFHSVHTNETSVLRKKIEADKETIEKLKSGAEFAKLDQENQNLTAAIQKMRREAETQKNEFELEKKKSEIALEEQRKTAEELQKQISSFKVAVPKEPVMKNTSNKPSEARTWIKLTWDSFKNIGKNQVTNKTSWTGRIKQCFISSVTFYMLAASLLVSYSMVTTVRSFVS